jgi:hypothetical protein
LEKAIPELEKATEADPLQRDIDPMRLATSRGHVQGPRRGAGWGRGRTPVPRAPPRAAQAASQPIPPLTLEVVGGGSERPRRRACTQEETTTTKKKK